MSAFSDKLHQRYPDLSELSIAILEALLEEAAKQAPMAPADKTGLPLDAGGILAPGLEKMEAQLTGQRGEEDPYRLLLKLPAQDLPLFPEDIWGLYQRSDIRRPLRYVLIREISRAGGLSRSRAESTVDFYLERLFDEVSRMAAEWCRLSPNATMLPVMRLLWEARPPAEAKPPQEEKGQGATPSEPDRQLAKHVDVGDIDHGAFVQGDHNVVINWSAADGRRAPDLQGILNSGPTESRPRVLEAAIEKQVQVGVAASLFVWIRREDSKSLLVAIASVDDEIVLDEKNIKARPVEIEFPLRDGKLRAAGIIVRLTAPDFAVDAPEKRISVPPEGDSEICTFAVTARKAGRLQLTLEVFKELTTIASRNLYTTALEGVKPVGSQPTGVVIPLIVMVPGIPARPVVSVKEIPPPVQVVGRPAIDEPDTGKRMKQPPVQAAGRPAIDEPDTQRERQAQAPASRPIPVEGPQRSTFSPALTIAGLLGVLLAAGALYVFGHGILATPIATPTQMTAVTSEPPPTVLPNPAWEAVLTDSFDDNQNHWLQTDNGPLIVGGDTQWQARITGDHLYEVSGSTTHAGGNVWFPFLPAMQPVDDFYYGMDIRIVSSSPGDAAALAFRLPDPQTAQAYYTFETKEPDWFRVVKHVPGEAPAEPLLDWRETFVIQPGQKNRFAVLGIGSQFRFFVNGSCVGQAQDDFGPYMSGIVGVFEQMQNAGDQITAEFDNAEVRIPSDVGNVRCP